MVCCMCKKLCVLSGFVTNFILAFSIVFFCGYKVVGQSTPGYHFISNYNFDKDSITNGWAPPDSLYEGLKVAVYFQNTIEYFTYQDSSWRWTRKNKLCEDIVDNYEALRNNPASLFCDLVEVRDFRDTVEGRILIVKGGYFVKDSLGLEDYGTTIVSRVDSVVWKRLVDGEVNPDWWENLKDSKKIQSAVNYAGNHGLVVFSPREYEIDDDIDLDTLQHLRLDGRKAILKAAAGIKRNTVLTSPYSGGSYQIEVANIPSSWEKGDILVLATGQSNDETSGRSLIDSISGNTVFIKYAFNSQGGIPFNAPAGANVTKYLVIFRGKPSADEGVFGTAGFNKGTIIENFIFDGNKQENNEVSLSWSVNSMIGLHGRGSEIRSCKFINAPSEVITGHGINVHDNVFENCNGSVYHLSAHDTTFPQSYPAYFVNNTVINCNTTPYSISGHNEGIISFSWNGGYIIINGNYFQAGQNSTGVIGSIEGYGQGPNDREIVILSNNYCKGFTCIVYGSNQNTTRSLQITGNIFEDCGCLLPTLVNATSVKMCGNVQVGTTNFGIDFRNNCEYTDVIDDSLGIGKNALVNTAANGNTAVGHYAMESNTGGVLNTAIGQETAQYNQLGERNTYVGSWAGISMTQGSENTIVGHWARGSSVQGNNNVHIGTESGRTNNGNGNVFIGYKAGSVVDGDDNLIINNNDSTPPLLEGKFNQFLTINGNLKVNGLNYLRLPRLTSEERDNLFGLEGGEMIFNLSQNKIQAFDGSTWIDL